MSQRDYLTAVLSAVATMLPERVTNIALYKTKIDQLVAEGGEDGMMALAICGLEGAVKAEDEDLATVKEG